MKIVFVLLLIIGLTCVPAHASIKCAPYNLVVSDLLDKFGEIPQSIGTTNKGSLIIKTLANSKTGTWTLISVDVYGLACMIIAGKNYTLIVKDEEI